MSLVFQLRSTERAPRDQRTGGAGSVKPSLISYATEVFETGCGSGYGRARVGRLCSNARFNRCSGADAGAVPAPIVTSFIAARHS